MGDTSDSVGFGLMRTKYLDKLVEEQVMRKMSRIVLKQWGILEKYLRKDLTKRQRNAAWRALLDFARLVLEMEDEN